MVLNGYYEDILADWGYHWILHSARRHLQTAGVVSVSPLAVSPDRQAQSLKPSVNREYLGKRQS